MSLTLKSKYTYDGKTGLPNYKTEIKNIIGENIFNKIAYTFTFNTKLSSSRITKISNQFFAYINRRLYGNKSGFFNITILENGNGMNNQPSHKRIPHLHGVLEYTGNQPMVTFCKWLRRQWENFTTKNGSAKVKILNNPKKWNWYITKQVSAKSGDTWLIHSSYR